MTVKIYDVLEKDLEKADYVVKEIMMNLKAQDAPIGDDLKLEDGWQMTWEVYPFSEFTRYRIFDDSG